MGCSHLRLGIRGRKGSPSEELIMIDSLNNFSRAAFLDATREERERLGSELATFLTGEMKVALRAGDCEARRYAAAAKCVALLKTWGHDYGAGISMRNAKHGGINYAQVGRDGIVVDFHLPDVVEVCWRESKVQAT